MTSLTGYYAHQAQEIHYEFWYRILLVVGFKLAAVSRVTGVLGSFNVLFT